MENVALQIWQILYTFVLRVENNTQLIALPVHFSRIIRNDRKLPTSEGYIFYSLQHFATKVCSFTQFRMLFQAVVIFSLISIFVRNFV